MSNQCPDETPMIWAHYGVTHGSLHRSQEVEATTSATLSEEIWFSLQWRYNERDGVSNHQPHDCLLNFLFRRRSKKTSKLHVTGFCEGSSPVTGEFPAQRASNAENVSIWWRHHVSTGPWALSPSAKLYPGTDLNYMINYLWHVCISLCRSLQWRHISVVESQNSSNRFFNSCSCWQQRKYPS